MVKKVFSYIYIYLILLVCYLPILYLIVYSFTGATILGQWSGFTFKLYGDLFNNKEIPRKSLKRLATTVVPIPKTLRTLCSAPKVPDTSSPGIRRTTTCIYQTSNRRLCVEQNWIKNRLFYYHKQKAALTNSCESRTFTSFFKVSFILFFRCLFGLLNILSIF